MSLNWKEIDVVLHELALPGTRIQDIVQPDFTSLILDLYRPGEPFRLLISLKQQETRLHRLTAAAKKPKTIQRFVTFLRSRVRGGRIVTAAQVNSDRIVLLEVERAGEISRIWVRLWGGAANIIVTDDANTILDAFYRRPAREEVSGARFRVDDPALDSKKRKPPEAFAVRELPGDGDFNSRVEQYYREQRTEADAESLHRRLEKAFADRGARIEATLSRLRARLEGYENPDRYRIYGDLITASMHTIHKGDTWLRTTNYYDENRPIDIELDPTRDPGRNAEAYYEKYKKAKSGLEIVREEVEQLERELARLDAERTRARESDDVRELRDLAEAASRRSRAEKPSGRDGGGPAAGDIPPGLAFESNGFRILVGRTARENEELLRRYARGNDTWLHARDYPGAYVFVKQIPGKSIPLETLLDAGNLAVFYSKARSSGQAELYYTQVKYLRRPKEGKRGLVLPTQEKNLSVRLEQSRLDRLQSRE